jgi:hypothetical protein
VDALAASLEQGGHRVLGQPLDLKLWMKLAQPVGDRDIPAGVTKPDR